MKGICLLAIIFWLFNFGDAIIGSEPYEEKAPYFVQLIVRREGDPSMCEEESVQLCSGAIVGTEWVVTAAKCAHRAAEISVQVGDFTDSKSQKETITASGWILNEDWGKRNVERPGDIGVVQLSKAVPEDRVIGLCSFVKGDGVALGMGQMSIEKERDNRPEVLHATTNIFSIYEFGKYWTHWGDYPGHCEQYFRCYTPSKYLLCEGDEGAPLVYNEDRLCLLGVGGHVEPTATKHCSGDSIFASMGSFDDWVKWVMKKGESKLHRPVGYLNESSDLSRP